MSSTVIDLSLDRETAKCHLMPCKIESDDVKVARIKEYFWPTIRLMEPDGDHAEGRTEEENVTTKNKNGPILGASFRGRPLHGNVIKLPEGYTANIVTRSAKDKNLVKSVTKKTAVKKLDEFTYWHWDQIPSNDDDIVKALKWLEVSKAIHR